MQESAKPHLSSFLLSGSKWRRRCASAAFPVSSTSSRSYLLRRGRHQQKGPRYYPDYCCPFVTKKKKNKQKWEEKGKTAVSRLSFLPLRRHKPPFITRRTGSDDRRHPPNAYCLLKATPQNGSNIDRNIRKFQENLLL